jgi:putative NADH-flavin reductase
VLSNRTLVLGVTALAPAIWGTTYLVTTELLPPQRPLLAAVVRALPAGLLLVAVTRRLPRGAWWWRAAVLGALNIGFFFALLFVAAYRLPGGVAATVGAVQPLLVAALSAGLLGDRLTPRTVLAGAAGVAGVGLLVLRADARLDGVGVLAALGGAVVMAVGVVLSKRWSSSAPLLATTGWPLAVRLPDVRRLRPRLRPLVPGHPRPAAHHGHLPRPAQPPGGHDVGLARARPGTHPGATAGRAGRPRRDRGPVPPPRSVPARRPVRHQPASGRAVSRQPVSRRPAGRRHAAPTDPVRRVMHITVFGAAGNVGRRVIAEASARGHLVTAAVRDPARAQDLPAGATVVRGDAADVDDVVALSVGRELVIGATRPVPGREADLVTTTRALLAGVARTRVRLLLVGGAATLTVPGAGGGTVIDDPAFPADWRAIALACRDQFDVCRADATADWTYLSPPALLLPGERTGRYRLGADMLVVGADGASTISYEDLAVALLDEAERPRHRRTRFTVGY